jgi:hypothetical protein
VDGEAGEDAELLAQHRHGENTGIGVVGDEVARSDPEIGQQ